MTSDNDTAGPRTRDPGHTKPTFLTLHCQYCINTLISFQILVRRSELKTDQGKISIFWAIRTQVNNCGKNFKNEIINNYFRLFIPLRQWIFFSWLSRGKFDWIWIHFNKRTGLLSVILILLIRTILLTSGDPIPPS